MNRQVFYIPVKDQAFSPHCWPLLQTAFYQPPKALIEPSVVLFGALCRALQVVLALAPGDLRHMALHQQAVDIFIPLAQTGSYFQNVGVMILGSDGSVNIDLLSEIPAPEAFRCHSLLQLFSQREHAGTKGLSGMPQRRLSAFCSDNDAAVAPTSRLPIDRSHPSGLK